MDQNVCLRIVIAVALAVAAGSAVADDPKPNYTLFNPDGTPLRATAKASSEGKAGANVKAAPGKAAARGYNPETLSRTPPPESGAKAGEVSRPYILGPLWNPKSKAPSEQ